MNSREKSARRRELYGLMGRLPARNRAVRSVTINREERPSYILERLLLDLNGQEAVPAYFVRPHGEGPFPTVLYNHAHGGNYVLGKNELLVGVSYLQTPPYADVLTGLGLAALCIDAWAFGERKGKTESEIFKEMLWRGQTMWGMMVYDSLKAVDYLTSRPDVDARRLGTLGLSMGSTMAWWVAALDTRIRVCVDLCCLTDFDALIATRGLDGHGIYYYVPDLLNHFSAGQINALISPRPHLGVVGLFDRLTPPEGVDRIDREVKAAYAADHASKAWRLHRYPHGHFETAAIREEVIAFLQQWL